MRLILKPWNSPPDFLVWSSFPWHSPGFTGLGEGLEWFAPFSLAGASLVGLGSWSLEVQQKFNGIHSNLLGRERVSPPFQLVGAWKFIVRDARCQIICRCQDRVLHALTRALGQQESSSSSGKVHGAGLYAGCPDLVLHALTRALGQHEVPCYCSVDNKELLWYFTYIFLVDIWCKY